MNIVVVCDDNYAIHLITLVISILENCGLSESIIINILDGGIKENNRNSLNKLSDQYKNLYFKYYEMGESKLRKLLGNNIQIDRSIIAYARIFIPELIEGDRVIYLDDDAIVLGNLRELYDAKLDGKAIGGVLDTNFMQRHYNVGLSDNDIYINAGMILFDLKKCREIDFTNRCLEFIRVNNGNVDAMDQGTVNGAMSKIDMIKVLNPKYNLLTSVYQMNPKEIKEFYGLKNYYDEMCLNEALSNPVFVHFTPNFTQRPWIENCKHPLKDKYWEYRNIYNPKKELDEDLRNCKIRLISFLFYHLPFPIFNYLSKLK